MSTHHDGSALPSDTSAPGLSGWIDGVASSVICKAAHNAPQALAERLKEEWLAELSQQHGITSRLGFALGCYWASAVIMHEHGAETTQVVAASPAGAAAVLPPIPGGRVFFSKPPGGAANAAAFCEINTTPLIDVMLVLLVTLIITLPLMTDAIKLDLPRAAPPADSPHPEVIELGIDFDGTVTWNGSAVASLQQLDGYFHTEAGKVPQPEIHLRPDRRARYDVVAKVLASAQRNRMERIGFANIGAFKE